MFSASYMDWALTRYVYTFLISPWAVRAKIALASTLYPTPRLQSPPTCSSAARQQSRAVACYRSCLVVFPGKPRRSLPPRIIYSRHPCHRRFDWVDTEGSREGAEMPTLTKLYSMEEAALHNTPDDCWVVVDGKVAPLYPSLIRPCCR